MKNIILILLLPLLGFSQNYENYLKEFTAEVGKHDFVSKSPLDAIPQTYFVFGSKGIARAAFRFHPSCWYDWKLEDGSIDQDVNDWNYKLFGISPILEPSNLNGLMIAARCLPDSFMMELCVYQNINKGFFPYEPTIKFDLRKVYRLYIQFHKSKIKDKIVPTVWAEDAQGNPLFTENFPLVNYRWRPSKSIFLWHGGRNSDEDKFGGTVSQKTIVYAKIMN